MGSGRDGRSKQSLHIIDLCSHDEGDDQVHAPTYRFNLHIHADNEIEVMQQLLINGQLNKPPARISLAPKRTTDQSQATQVAEERYKRSRYNTGRSTISTSASVAKPHPRPNVDEGTDLSTLSIKTWAISGLRGLVPRIP